MIGVGEIPYFQTMSRKAKMLVLHPIIWELTLFHSKETFTTVESFAINTCKYSTPM